MCDKRGLMLYLADILNALRDCYGLGNPWLCHSSSWCLKQRSPDPNVAGAGAARYGNFLLFYFTSMSFLICMKFFPSSPFALIR